MATIRTAADKVPATVAGFGKLKDGNYGPYQSVLFEGPGLPDGKLWRSMPPEQAQQFNRGQRVYLVPTTSKGKPSWDIELIGDAPAPQVAPVPPAAAGSQAQAIGEYVDRLAALYAACYRRAAATLDGAPDAAIQAAASSVFIATQRKFNL
jgi:hypothetical protein